MLERLAQDLFDLCEPEIVQVMALRNPSGHCAVNLRYLHRVLHYSAQLCVA